MYQPTVLDVESSIKGYAVVLHGRILHMQLVAITEMAYYTHLATTFWLMHRKLAANVNNHMIVYFPIQIGVVTTGTNL